MKDVIINKSFVNSGKEVCYLYPNPIPVGVLNFWIAVYSLNSKFLVESKNLAVPHQMPLQSFEYRQAFQLTLHQIHMVKPTQADQPSSH